MKVEVIPAFIIVDYAWAVLQANDPVTWDKAKYDGIIPVVPLSEEPELDDFTGPHIVYGYSDEATGTLPERNFGSLAFAVYDQNFRRLTRTMTVLKTAFERQDETARDINNFSSYFLGHKPVYSSSGDILEEGIPGPYWGLRFGSVDIAFVEGGSPEETEGGRQSAIISIRYDYFVDYDVVTSV